MNAFQEKILEAYKVFSNFCEEKGLEFFACGGTAIGAVRHHGFIPWDDDMDLYMKREDYQKLISMRREFESLGYELLCCDDVETGYPYPFAKFSCKSCTVLVALGQSYVTGPWIDIMQLDEIEEKDYDYWYRRFNKWIKRYEWSISFYSLSDIYKCLFVNKYYYEGLCMIRRNFFFPKWMSDYFLRKFH